MGVSDFQPQSPALSDLDVCEGAQPLSEVYRQLRLSGSCIRSFSRCNSSYWLPSEPDLMGIISELEHEREAYLEAVVILQDKLHESHEHCQQMSESHAEIVSELEVEITNGWHEAERWKNLYNHVKQVANSIGLDLSILTKAGSEVKANVDTFTDAAPGGNRLRNPSVASEACTVVTQRDLENYRYGLLSSKNYGVRVYTLNTGREAFVCESPRSSKSNEDGASCPYAFNRHLCADSLSHTLNSDGFGTRNNALDIHYKWHEEAFCHEGWINLTSPRNYEGISCGCYARNTDGRPYDYMVDRSDATNKESSCSLSKILELLDFVDL